MSSANTVSGKVLQKSAEPSNVIQVSLRLSLHDIAASGLQEHIVVPYEHLPWN